MDRLCVGLKFLIDLSFKNYFRIHNLLILYANLYKKKLTTKFKSAKSWLTTKFKSIPCTSLKKVDCSHDALFCLVGEAGVAGWTGSGGGQEILEED